MSGLAGRVALVTGASRGMGRAGIAVNKLWIGAAGLVVAGTALAGCGTAIGPYSPPVSISSPASPASAAATPVFSPAGGTFSATQTVTISDATSEAQIYYTTNGTAPTASSNLYGSAITVSSTETIEAIAVASGYATSAVASATFTITAAPPPAANVGEWVWESGANTVNAAGVYGALGTASASFIPESRNASATWTDASGNLWLFGGESYLPMPGTIGATILFNDLWEFNPRTGEWAWASGSNVTDASGVYGTEGVASTGNTPSARSGSVTWTDGSGNLWLFGGFNPNVYSNPPVDFWFNDLWKFNPTNRTWTWVSGSSTPNAPGSYGTLGNASGGFPGARFGAVSWTDRLGNFWLFGGEGYDSTHNVVMLNDLWKLNPTSGQWTWVSGSTIGNAAGVYGGLGVASASVAPGGRWGAYAWTDNGGNLWLFGGEGYGATPGASNFCNDLWEYSPTSGQWTWVSGSNTLSAPGVYGTQGVAAASNVPGARYFGSNWTDLAGNLWLFGGYSNIASGSSDWTNDLWEFNPTTRLWTWMSGSNKGEAPGIYGTQGTPAPANVPGARIDSVGWTDPSGAFWLFGGISFDSQKTQGESNDLWRYQP
jgi:N-acetylneuraminic acid mutarotase